MLLALVHDPGGCARRLPGDPPLPDEVTRGYLWCNPGTPTFTVIAASLQADPAGEYSELASGHDAMVTMPEELAALLLANESSHGPSPKS